MTDYLIKEDVFMALTGDITDCTIEEFIARLRDKLSKLPSVGKDINVTTNEDCISRQAVLNGLASIAKAKAKSDAQKALMGRVMFFTEKLPSVTPKEKTGKWILTDVEGNRVWHCNCSECGKDPQDYIGGSENWWMIKNKLPKYCPNCGKRMEVEE